MILVNNTKVEPNKFPDGTFNLKINEELINDINIKWKYESEEELSLLYYIVKFIRSKEFRSEIILHLPYIPNARMDRVKNENEVFTLKFFCEFINSLNFKFVNVWDPHSNVSVALLNNVIIQYPINLESLLLKNKIDMNFYPDEGAVKKYSDMFKIPYAFGIKKRNWDDGKIIGLDIIGDVKNKNIMIVDDICCYGGTFYHAAIKLKEFGAKDIYLVITHCENSILKGILIKSGLIKKIYTTDSIFTKHHKLIEVIKI